jgi:hypothetical protein
MARARYPRKDSETPTKSKYEELKQILKDLALQNGDRLKVKVKFIYCMGGCGPFSTLNQKDSKGKVNDF